MEIRPNTTNPRLRKIEGRPPEKEFDPSIGKRVENLIGSILEEAGKINSKVLREAKLEILALSSITDDEWPQEIDPNRRRYLSPQLLESLPLEHREKIARDVEELPILLSHLPHEVVRDMISQMLFPEVSKNQKNTQANSGDVTQSYEYRSMSEMMPATRALPPERRGGSKEKTPEQKLNDTQMNHGPAMYLAVRTSREVFLPRLNRRRRIEPGMEASDPKENEDSKERLESAMQHIVRAYNTISLAEKMLIDSDIATHEWRETANKKDWDGFIDNFFLEKGIEPLEDDLTEVDLRGRKMLADYHLTEDACVQDLKKIGSREAFTKTGPADTLEGSCAERVMLFIAYQLSTNSNIRPEFISALEDLLTKLDSEHPKTTPK